MRRYISLLLFIGLSFAQDITIAVLDFDGDGISQSETRTLTNRLRDELIKTDVFIVLERGKMDEVLIEQGFQQTGCTTSECAVEVGRMLGVQQMVAGSIGKVGTVYTVSARIFDVQTGKILKSANYDHIGNIGQLLTKGMKQLAYDLSGKKLVSNESKILEQKPKNNISSSFVEVMPSVNCYDDGYNLGQSFGTSKTFIGSACSGFGLGIIGAGIAYGIVAMSNPIPPSKEEYKNDADCFDDFKRGYKKGALKVKKRASLTGGLLGTLIIMVSLAGSG